MCSTVNTHITSSSFQVLVRRKSYIFPFFDSTSTFFLTVNGSVFGRALARLDMAFFLTFVLLSGCVLEETHGTFALLSGCLLEEMHGTNNLAVGSEAELNAEHKLLY